MKRIRLNEAQLRRMVRRVLAEQHVNEGFLDSVKSFMGMESRDGQRATNSVKIWGERVAGQLADYIRQDVRTLDELENASGDRRLFDLQRRKADNFLKFYNSHIEPLLRRGFSEFLKGGGFEAVPGKEPFNTSTANLTPRVDQKGAKSFASEKWDPEVLMLILREEPPRGYSMADRSGVLYVWRELHPIRKELISNGVHPSVLEVYVDKIIRRIAYQTQR